MAEEEAAMTAVAEDGTEPMASLQAESPAQWITCWGDKWGWQVSHRKPNREFKCPRWRSAVGSQAAQPHGAAHTDADAASTASCEGDGSVAGGGNNIEPAASPPQQHRASRLATAPGPPAAVLHRPSHPCSHVFRVAGHTFEVALFVDCHHVTFVKHTDDQGMVRKHRLLGGLRYDESSDSVHYATAPEPSPEPEAAAPSVRPLGCSRRLPSNSDRPLWG